MKVRELPSYQTILDSRHISVWSKPLRSCKRLLVRERRQVAHRLREKLALIYRNRQHPHQRAIPVSVKGGIAAKLGRRAVHVLVDGFSAESSDIKNNTRGRIEMFASPLRKLPHHVIGVKTFAKTVCCAERHRSIIRPGARRLIVMTEAGHAGAGFLPHCGEFLTLIGNPKRVCHCQTVESIIKHRLLHSCHLLAL